MKGCIDCKHYKHEMLFNEQNKFDSVSSCEMGNQEEMAQWWMESAHKKRGVDTFTEMACHEYSEGTKLLDGMIQKLDQMLSELKKL